MTTKVGPDVLTQDDDAFDASFLAVVSKRGSPSSLL
jgi:hypothetical protein